MLREQKRYVRRLKPTDIAHSGAGGMALGFLQAQTVGKKLDLWFSGEVEPIYTRTLRDNHRRWNQLHPGAGLPDEVEAVDLAADESFERIREITRARGDATIVVGGPPCQGFEAMRLQSFPDWFASPETRRAKVAA